MSSSGVLKKMGLNYVQACYGINTVKYLFSENSDYNSLITAEWSGTAYYVVGFKYGLGLKN